MQDRTETLRQLHESMQTRTLVMGVLNRTPDSFYDGGRYSIAETALQHARQLISEGADILDIGGESTRPGSDPVSVQEELRRVIPVIEAISSESDIAVSIDTFKSEVARQALQAGAHIVNDISGMRFDTQMPAVVAGAGAGVVLMHMQGSPKTMQQNPHYEDVVSEVKQSLSDCAQNALRAGIHADCIWLDPGIGFGKTVEHNLQLLCSLSEFRLLGYPLLIGTSRKSFIGKLLGDLPPNERLEGTLATLALAVREGANIVRVHDVQAAVRAVRVTDAIIKGRNMS
jgi:dihydropteroate synthase